MHKGKRYLQNPPLSSGGKNPDSDPENKQDPDP